MKEPRKRIKTHAEIEVEKQNARRFLGPQLPVGEWLAIYARQSTNAQAEDHNEQQEKKEHRSLVIDKPDATNLLKAVITAPSMSVYCIRRMGIKETYTINAAINGFTPRYMTNISVADLDAVFLQKMFERLETFACENSASLADNLYSHLQEAKKASNEELISIPEQIEGIINILRSG